MFRLVVLAWALAAAIQLVLWLIARRTRNAAIVDVGWAASFTAVMALFAAIATTPPSIYLPMLVTVSAWSLRLSLHLVARGALSGPEEGRYRDLRARWSPHADRAFFIFFQAQAVLVAVLTVAMAAPFVSLPVPSRAPLLWFGTALSALGILGESIADLQLQRFRRAHHGQQAVCDVGLWAYSRHPNYFFEWCVWLGFALHSLAFPFGIFAFFAPTIILASIFGVTGIPPTEAQALRSRGDAYRDYQRRVSRFVPWPPKAYS